MIVKLFHLKKDYFNLKCSELSKPLKYLPCKLLFQIKLFSLAMFSSLLSAKFNLLLCAIPLPNNNFPKLPHTKKNRFKQISRTPDTCKVSSFVPDPTGNEVHLPFHPRRCVENSVHCRFALRPQGKSTRIHLHIPISTITNNTTLQTHRDTHKVYSISARTCAKCCFPRRPSPL